MARSNASTALWPRSGLMPIPITVTKPAPRPTRTGCITIITTAPTLVSEAQRPQIAFTTSRGTTLRLSRRRSGRQHKLIGLHAAGPLRKRDDDRALLARDRAQIDPRIRGAWRIHQSIQRDPVEPCQRQ